LPKPFPSFVRRFALSAAELSGRSSYKSSANSPSSASENTDQSTHTCVDPTLQ
jgi:hypothetical protein